ncbi:MAG: hypothetical protein HOW73_05100 [Polyangiaceae bacterium]|nr:hypothetical protein [Polyangiaceae bacterium]
MTALPPPRRKGPLRPLGFGVLAALLWGGWALYVNASAGAGPAARATLAQALLSFSATAGLSFVLERLFRLGRTPLRGFFIAAVGTTSISASTMATVHAIVGTPRILATVGPTVALGATFFTVYAWGLRSAASRNLPS